MFQDIFLVDLAEVNHREDELKVDNRGIGREKILHLLL